MRCATPPIARIFREEIGRWMGWFRLLRRESLRLVVPTPDGLLDF